VQKEDVKTAVADGVITISGERKLERENQSENAIRVESIYGAFTRSFVLLDNADTEGIQAESKDGVLRIHIPKAKTKKPEPLAIEVH
jgi:HSP20 family protein